MANRVRKINIDTGTVHYVIRSTEFASSNVIEGLDVSNNGTLYAVDFANDIVYKVYEDGRILGALAGVINTTGDVEASGVESVDGNELGGQNARFNAPNGVCVDASDNIFITDSTNRKVKRLSSSGRTKDLAGDGTAGDAIADDGRDARFSSTLSGICVDKSGILYVADTGNHKIKKIWPSGKVVSLAGSSGGAGFLNGQGAAARFSSPSDVAVDNSGNVYVADRGNNAIRKIDSAGNVTIVAGGASGAGSSGFVDGDGTTTRFNQPYRLAIDPSGQFLVVIDENNSAIRRVATNGRTTTLLAYNVPSSGHGDLTIDKSGFLYVAEGD